MTGPPIPTDDLAKRYGDESAVEGRSLAVSVESVYGLLGPNDAPIGPATP